MQIELDQNVVRLLNKSGRRIGVENNPIEVIVRALSLFDEVSESVSKGYPVVIEGDHPMLQPVVE